MKMTRRVTAAIIALMVIVAIFTGCSKKNDLEDTAAQTTAEITTGEATSNATATSEATTDELKLPSELTKVGDVVYFGEYEQDNDLTNGKESIAWRVLAVDNGKALLLAEKILDSRKYNEELKDVTWETCTLRAWLNDEFINTVFDETAIARIPATKLVNADNAQYGTLGGNDTEDKVFLLSFDDVSNPAYGFHSDSLEKDTARRATGTAFAQNNGIVISDQAPYSGNGIWWLRSPGTYQTDAFCVSVEGEANNHNFYADEAGIGVRPAIWVVL